MLQKELTREQALQTGEQLLAILELPILERGYSYFSDGAVFNTRVQDGRYLASNVQGTAVYDVLLDLKDVQNSTCSCPYTRCCKHIAATFFQMYSVFDNPRSFLARARQPRSPVFTPSMLIPAYRDVLKQISDEREAPSPTSPLRPQSSVDEWWSFMESWTRNLPAAMEQHRASTELMTSYQNLLHLAVHWNIGRARLFSIHAILFHLLTLEDFVHTHRHSNWSVDLTQTAEKLLEHLEGSLYELDTEQMQKDFPAEWEATLAITSRLKRRNRSALYWAYAYRMIWWELGANVSWVEREVAELEHELQFPTLSPGQHEMYRLFRAHFFVQEGHDQPALEIWLSLPRIPLSFYLYYIKAFARDGEWARVLVWTKALERQIATAVSADYRFAVAIWQEAMKNVGKAEECGRELRNFLPASFYEYSSHLEENGEHRRWIDLHLSYQTPLADLPPARIKMLEESEPELLFPVYLQEVNRLIQKRTRPSYQEAIRHLKKVRALYQKADREQGWNEYVKRLMEKHNRLRAFQEEVRRGNLSL
ncbi:SWIM zinc finger domain-containing protein [Brevibacillus sp. TJ4]|uniref:SWIM zinc finger family protein n=1 Tax=Brevibacillus sp. TJ4 TaxID=3234853 RepID=UPI0037D335CB